MGRTVEVQTTTVITLRDEQDPTNVAERILDYIRGLEDPGRTRVDLNKVTLREGRRILQQYHYKRR